MTDSDLARVDTSERLTIFREILDFPRKQMLGAETYISRTSFALRHLKHVYIHVDAFYASLFIV